MPEFVWHAINYFQGDAWRILDPYLQHVHSKAMNGNLDLASAQVQLRAIDKLGEIGAQKVSKEDRYGTPWSDRLCWEHKNCGASNG